MSNQEAIARRAYELYLERGSAPGHELEDWLAAEAEIGTENIEASSETSADEPSTTAPSPQRRKRDAGGASSNRRTLRP